LARRCPSPSTGEETKGPGEVEAFPLEALAAKFFRVDEVGSAYRRQFDRFLRPPPLPRVPLDPPATTLLQNAARRAGLAYAARCMAAWWFLTDTAMQADSVRWSSDVAAAAAVEWIVAKRAGIQIKASTAAGFYDCEVEDVPAQARRFQALVRDALDTRW
jgi:hypothetical protein